MVFNTFDDLIGESIKEKFKDCLVNKNGKFVRLCTILFSYMNNNSPNNSNN